MGLGSSKLPRDREGAEIKLRSEVLRLGDVIKRYESVQISEFGFDNYLREVMQTGKELTQLYREARGRQVPGWVDLSTLAARFGGSAVCKRLFDYLNSHRTDLVKRRPVLPPLSQMFHAAGLGMECLRSDAGREMKLRKDIQSGEESVVRQPMGGFTQRRVGARAPARQRKRKAGRRSQR